MDTVRGKGLYSIEDVYSWPDGKRVELIDGEIYVVAPPRTAHQRISQKVSWEIENYIRSKDGNCEVFTAPFAVFLNQDNENVVEPDISVICDKNKLEEDGCHGAPDWIIEVVSPGSKCMDYMIKLFKYRAAGVREYWIIDQPKNRILVYNFEQDNMEEYSLRDAVTAGIYGDLKIDFSKMKI